MTATQTVRDMEHAVRPVRIGIWGHYHGGNQGDELVVATLIANIRARIPNAEFVGFCINPAAVTEMHGIPAHPIYRPNRLRRSSRPGEGRASSWWRRALATLGAFLYMLLLPAREILFLARCYVRLRRVDMLIVAGSGPLSDDWSGPLAHPYAIFIWSFLARCAGTRFLCLSTGGGPLDAALSRYFVRAAVRSARYCSYRDIGTARLVESLGIRGPHRVFPDMGFAFDVARYSRRSGLPASADGRTIVGVNLMAHWDARYSPRGDRNRYERYTLRMAEFCATLLRADCAVVLLYSQTRADPQVGIDVRKLLARHHGFDSDARLIEVPTHGYPMLVNLISWCDFVVAARFHCIVLPCALAIPTLALAYNPKTTDLMESMDQSRYCLPIDEFETAELLERFDELRAHRRRIEAQLLQRARQCRAQLAEQFDEVFGRTSHEGAGRPITGASWANYTAISYGA